MIDNSNFFIISDYLLKNRSKKWTVRDFENLKISKHTTSQIFKELCQREILERNTAYGKFSHCILKKPKKLIKLCLETFKNPDMKKEFYISKKTDQQILSGLKNLSFEFYLAKFSGIPKEYYHVEDHKLHVFCFNRDFFKTENKNRMLWEMDLHQVKSNGSLIVYFPKYKKFLRYSTQKKEGMNIPSNFYTFLDLHNMNHPMSKMQIKWFLENIKEKDRYFV